MSRRPASSPLGKLWSTATDLSLSFPEKSSSRWQRRGMSRRAEKIFNVVSAVLLVVFTLGWSWSIANARTAGAIGVTPATGAITSALTESDAPSLAYVTDAMLDKMLPSRGESGKLRAEIAQGGQPGIWKIALAFGKAVKPLADFSVITLRPASDARSGRIGLYYMGHWPVRANTPKADYTPPSGFIEVTPDNANTPLSEHFNLGDFLPHDQPNVWPKYEIVSLKLIDKLELVLQELQSEGINPNGVHVMSGFRTPQYNETGGDPSGRAGLSRHMYGDAADIFIDNDHNGSMDDLNHDGRVDIADSRMILVAVSRVEAAHPSLIGGCGVYSGTPAHGPFTHIDTRGYPARW